MGRATFRLILSLLIGLLLQMGPVAMTHAAAMSSTMPMGSPAVSMEHHGPHHMMMGARYHALHTSIKAQPMMHGLNGDMTGKCCLTHLGLCDLVTLDEARMVPQRRDGYRVVLRYDTQKLPSFFIPAFLRPPLSTFA